MTADRTDPSTLDEKLAWLRRRGISIKATLHLSGLVVVRGLDMLKNVVGHACGKDIHEATARLVVAVEEAMS